MYQFLLESKLLVSWFYAVLLRINPEVVLLLNMMTCSHFCTMFPIVTPSDSDDYQINFGHRGYLDSHAEEVFRYKSQRREP